MLRFLLILQILFFSVNVSCQNTNIHNQSDVIGNQTRLCVEYDIEHIKYSETMYVGDSVEYTHYFTRKGDTISVYSWEIDVTVIKKIQEQILNNFMLNDFTHATGGAILLLLLDFENNVSEIRVIRGITQNFNKELLRVINKIEKN